MKKYIKVIILYLLMYAAFPCKSYAKEYMSQEDGFDVIFVMDCSGSMKTNDPGGIGKGMVKAFIDTVHIEDIRVGYLAYSDSIVTSVHPMKISTPSERQHLKELIDGTPYSGDTDIGLGILKAYELMPAKENRKRLMVLISDGVSDLKGNTGRTLRQSNEDLNQCIIKCREEEIPIYTIAFGQYEGSKGTLEKIAKETNANNYSAESPETLIEVLYGIFNENLSYKIQQFSSGIYAGGHQEIRCILDENYLDELDVLIISSEQIGETTLQYGEKQIPMSNQSYYAVGKISAKEIESSVKELTVHASTNAGQTLKVFLLSYRTLTPVFDIDNHVPKNQDVEYQLYFTDRNGEIVRNEEFYKKFQWNLSCISESIPGNFRQLEETYIKNGILHGVIHISHSGVYELQGKLSDDLGSYPFNISLDVANQIPKGNLPTGTAYTILSEGREYPLDEYFSDPDGDLLTFSLKETDGTWVKAQVEDGVLVIKPIKSGNQILTLQVSDGEEILEYPYSVTIIPLWKAYWWVIVLLCAVMIGIWRKFFYKPKPMLEQIVEERKRNQFCGKLDLYFTRQPDMDTEIPPLSFQMHKVKDSKVTLGNLLWEYPEVRDQLNLDCIYLIADEERRMILYHTAETSVMIGNSIACRQIQYSVGFGDVIYVTSQDNTYDLEVHYIAVIQ